MLIFWWTLGNSHILSDQRLYLHFGGTGISYTVGMSKKQILKGKNFSIYKIFEKNAHSSVAKACLFTRMSL